MAPRFPLARGWERQLDIKYNSLFYNGTLTAATYHTWLHKLAVRFVAVSDADLDYSAHEETALIDRGLPYLRLVFRSAHWHVYAVDHPTPIAQGAATLQTLGAELADAAGDPARHREAARALHALLGAVRGAGVRDRQRRIHGAATASSGHVRARHAVLSGANRSDLSALRLASLTGLWCHAEPECGGSPILPVAAVGRISCDA